MDHLEGLTPNRPGVALIGSFRQHYEDVLQAIAILESRGLHVTSPAGTGILEEGIDFVRFESDDAQADDYLVQSVTMERILRSDVVYVVAPDGYIGRTTCYEVGRVRQAGVPLYFSHPPRDLPMRVPLNRVAAPAGLATLTLAGGLTAWEYPAEHADSAVEYRLSRLGGPG